jgi:hypothetical protein
VEDGPDREVCVPGQIRGMTSKRFLTDDELVGISLDGDRRSFRLRIWRGKACPAIVLVSQLARGPSPSWSSSQVANLIQQTYLGFPVEGLLYFEDEIILGERRLFRVSFVTFGQGLRQWMTSPNRYASCWSELEELVGEAIPL